MSEHPTITALRETAPHRMSPLPWRYNGFDVVDAAGGVVVRGPTKEDGLHIAAAVNAAPHLLAEVDQLRERLAAAREAVAKRRGHDRSCPTWWDSDEDCNCGHTQARLALGLEVKP